MLVRQVLTAAGHQVIEADCGVEGIRLAASQQPAIVLVDIDVPDLDGYEVTLRLRGMPTMQGTPIVAITGEGDREALLAVGADGSVDKPIDTARLPGVLAHFLAGNSERTVQGSDEILRARTQKIVERLEAKLVELSEANRRLEEAARLRQEFFQNMSHEFATPMTPVVGYLRLLLAEEVGPLTPLQRKCVDSIKTATDKLRFLVDTLLDVSHLETGRLHLFERTYDFAEVATKALAETTARLADAQVVVLREGFEQALEASGDPDKLRRAMVHILDNAIKFTPRHGRVGVLVRAANLDGVPCYQFMVTDSGPGISEDDQQRILEPFFQVDGSRTRVHGGVGLGLAYARHVALALGGHIRVESPPTAQVAGVLLRGTAVTLSVARRAHLEEVER